MRNNDSLLSCLQKKHGENNYAIAEDAKNAYGNFLKFMNKYIEFRLPNQFEFILIPWGYQSFLIPIDTIVRIDSRIGIVVGYRGHSDGWSIYIKCSDGSYDVRYEDVAIAPLPDGLVDLIRRTEK